MTQRNKQKHQFVMVCKSYRDDLDHFVRFYKSYTRHNLDDIPLFVSVPKEDAELFGKHVNKKTEIITDESYAKKYFANTGYWNLSVGYINQEICKLCFWELGISENFLFVDSDAYLIRDFSVKDFMANEHVPFSVLLMDKDLNMEYDYKEFGAWRRSQIQKIFNEVGVDDCRLMTCHGMTVMSSRVLEDFKNNFMTKRELGYKDLLEISPYEYSWYNAWLQHSNIIKIMAVEPFFKTFHTREEYIFSRLRLVTEADISQQYLGIVLNSNWSSKLNLYKYEDPGMLCAAANKILRVIIR